jgi:hypothetical protein
VRVVVDKGEESFHSYSIHPLNHMHSVELTCCSRPFPSFICELAHKALLGAERNWVFGVALENFMAESGVVLGCTHSTSLFKDGVFFCSSSSPSD